MDKHHDRASNTSVERDLDSLLRRTGDLPPTSPEDVAAAEERVASESFSMPARLRHPPDLQAPPRSSARRWRASYWTHPSVLGLNAEHPVEAITLKARELVMNAIEKGWAGPPYDPSQLADHLGISVLPTENVIDARTRAKGSGFQIEFNPLRPAARLRFSIAHEIAHTLFPDCAAAIRNRATHEQMTADEWQLEMLCNIAASEILMPVGSLPQDESFRPTVDSVLHFRRVFQVSAESVLFRLVRISTITCFGFAAHREPGTGRYRLDYTVAPPFVQRSIPFSPGFALPRDTRARECTAIGYTARGHESWLMAADWEVEYVGIPPYPGHSAPRVLGVAKPRGAEAAREPIRFLKGDATEPRGQGIKLLCQIVNDKALTWGAGFARVVRNKWPRAQGEFTRWVLANRRDLQLGNVKLIPLSDELILANLVAQHGYGESDKPRIRYAALEKCLRTVAELARQRMASVHLPRIGTGQAGGQWGIVHEILRATLCSAGLDVTVYDLPSQAKPAASQPTLFDVPSDLDQLI